MIEEIEFRADDGIKLAATRFGKANNQSVLLLHGAGQTRHSWRRAGETLAAAGWCAVALDARGHGDSDWAPDGNYRIDRLIADLRGIVEQLPVQPAVVGASLGGITSLLLQGEESAQLFRSLVMVDVTPRIDRSGVERIIAFMRQHSNGFESVEEVAAAVAAYQPHRKSGEGSLDGLRKNVRQRDGRYYWHWDPCLLDHVSNLDSNGLVRMQTAASRLKLPVLLVHGRLSDIVSDETAREFLQLVPHARYVDVQDAAHMVAGDENDRFNDAVIEFLDANSG